ncbi:VOC family protein [Pseudonocardiaceae bacterium YIM PH 21723]|nr:VOC family protein [Pseudonocardiaceae bacterium YIM PH 21723]
MGAKQVKIGLRVKDLRRSGELYLRLGFREIPNDEVPTLRYLTYGNTWLILIDQQEHDYYRPEERVAVTAGPPGVGFTMALPVPDLDAAHRLWRDAGLPIVMEPKDAGFARVFSGLDPDGYQVTFEQFGD